MDKELFVFRFRFFTISVAATRIRDAFDLRGFRPTARFFDRDELSRSRITAGEVSFGHF